MIDVGINAKPDETKAKGYRLVGDVDFESASRVAGQAPAATTLPSLSPLLHRSFAPPQITPVPGGVGPLTIAMLMRNVYCAARRRAAELA